MLKKIKLSTATIIVALSLIGCGGGGSNTSDINKTKNPQAGSNNSNVNKNLNKTEGDIKKRLSYIYYAKDLVSGKEKKTCHKMANGHSYTLTWLVQPAKNELDAYYYEYSNQNCVGDYPDVRNASAKYRLTFGNVINNGKALEVDMQFVSGDDITDAVPNHILGYDVAETYHTIVVSAGSHTTNNLVWGVAKPTQSNNGSSSTKRANNISDYTSGKFYFAQ